jgi:hypothetical protein
MNHNDLLNQHYVLSLASVCAILGGDGAPVSENTVQRLVRAGHLDRAIKGKITTESIRRYLENPQWRDENDARRDRAASTAYQDADGGRNARGRHQTASDDSSALLSTPKIRLLNRLPRGRRNSAH